MFRADAEHERIEQEQEIADLGAELNAENLLNADRTDHVHRLKDDLAVLNSELNHLEAEIKELTHQIHVLEDEGVRLESELRQLEDRLTFLEAEQAKLITMVAQLEEKCAHEERICVENKARVAELIATRDSLRLVLERGDAELRDVKYSFNLSLDNLLPMPERNWLRKS